MLVNGVKILFISFTVLLMFGCREYNLYQYKPVTLSVLGGELVVALEGTYGQNYEKDGKKLADFGAPYSLRFMLSMPYEFGLSELVVKDVEVVGEESRKRVVLLDTNSRKVKDPRKRSNPDAEFRTVIASISDLSSGKFLYETYHLTATVVVHEDNKSFREESISIRLETDYKTEQRSDWFDKNMSI